MLFFFFTFDRFEPSHNFCIKIVIKAVFLRLQKFFEKLNTRVLNFDFWLFFVAAAKPAGVLMLIFSRTYSKKFLLTRWFWLFQLKMVKNLNWEVYWWFWLFVHLRNNIFVYKGEVFLLRKTQRWGKVLFQIFQNCGCFFKSLRLGRTFYFWSFPYQLLLLGHFSLWGLYPFWGLRLNRRFFLASHDRRPSFDLNRWFPF